MPGEVPHALPVDSHNTTAWDDEESRPHPSVSADEITALFENVAEAVGDLEQKRSGSLKELQEVAIQLAVAVAAKITRNSIEQHQHAVTELVTEAVGKLEGDGPVVVQLNPVDLELLEKQLGDSPPPWNSSRTVQFSAVRGNAAGQLQGRD